MNRRIPFLSLLLFLVVIITAGAAAGAPAPTSGFRALSGAEAAAFTLPADVEPVRSFALANGLTYERYQQVYNNAHVLGGQLTLYREAGGTVVAVIGAHYPQISATNQVNLTAAAARQRSARDIGAGGERLVQLQIDPANGRYFYAVETRRPDSRWIHWIGAGNGQILNKFNALAHNCDGAAAPCGFGVQYTEDSTDVKDLTGLTTLSGGNYLLRSQDNRQETHDQGSSWWPFLGPVASDADNSWVRLGNESPAQQALVDAQYYANVTDDYYLAVYGYDWVAEAIAAGSNNTMEIHAHYSLNYNNAAWNGTYVVLGDGDQVTWEELTSLDVVGHELTHGVTDFTSDLIYQNQSGALNESFSDIMGSSMEFWAESVGREPATTLEPDWQIGEDFDLTNDTVLGLRNMADPGEDGDPSHYDERYTGTGDNGGVHTNSGISNHWYYLLVNGGKNADPAWASDTNVAGIGLAEAEQIAFLSFTALPADATFCDARAGTLALAGAYQANVADAWDEVGVDTTLCGGTPVDNPPSVTLTNPADGATVSGTVAVTADAGDDNSVTQVEFLIDGGSIGIDTDGNDGWSASWDTTVYADGAHTVEAIATDSAAQTATDSIGVTVDNGTTVDNPPSVTLTNPADGATVSGTVAVTADAGDDNGVTQVEFLIDGGSIGIDTDGTDGWSASWDTTAYADGAHTVEAVATDSAAQTGSDTISVTVDNGSSTTFTLSATGRKVRGEQIADLSWGGTDAAQIDVYRDNILVATTPNDGEYTHSSGQKGGGSATYQVCEAGTSTCSNPVTVDF